MPDVSGVGISFGADRIYDVLSELSLFPENLAQTARVMFVNFGPAEAAYCVRCAQQLRAAGIPNLIFPEAAKMKKQMEYADRKGIPFVAFVGEEEMQAQQVKLKNMASGDQCTVQVDKLAEALQ